MGLYSQVAFSGEVRGYLMILEIAQISVLPGCQSAFELALKKGVTEVLFEADGFIDFEFFQGIEDENSYTLLIHWRTLEDHMVTFREGPLFPQWRSLIAEFFVSPPVVTHANSIAKLSK